jgi:hypothetical protein
MEALRSCETSVLTRATRRNTPDCILHSYRRENLGCYMYGIISQDLPKPLKISLPFTKWISEYIPVVTKKQDRRFVSRRGLLLQYAALKLAYQSG